MKDEHENTPYPEALQRIEQAIARVQVAADLAAQKIEIAAKAAAEDAIDSAKQIAVLIERVSTHIERKDLHGAPEAVTKLQDDMRANRKWLIGVLLSAVGALIAVIWQTVAGHISGGVTP